MKQDQQHVCIIGGGLVGVACAHYLLAAGYAVTLVERNQMGAESSHGNCGLVSPSHILPLAHAGMIQHVLKLMLTEGKSSGFVVKPQASLAFWHFMWQFAWNCKEDTTLRLAKARAPLLKSTYELYQQLFASNKIKYRWQQKGLLHAYYTSTGFEQASSEEHGFIRQQFGIEAKRLEAKDLAQFEPTLKSGLAGGWFYPGDAHLQPNLLLRSWVEYLCQQGLQIREHCEAQALLRQNGKAKALLTTQGEIGADHFVFACGAFTPQLQAELKCKLLIQPAKGYSLSFQYDKPMAKLPIYFPEHSVVMTPMDQYYRLGSIIEFRGYDKTLDRQRLDLLKQRAALYFKNPCDEPIVEEWCGLRPMTPDDLPYIGRCPSIDNAYVAAGHSMWGITLAPVTGKLIAELVSGVKPHIDLQPYRLNR